MSCTQFKDMTLQDSLQLDFIPSTNEICKPTHQPSFDRPSIVKERF